MVGGGAEQHETHKVQLAEVRRRTDGGERNTSNLGHGPAIDTRADCRKRHRPGTDPHGFSQ